MITVSKTAQLSAAIADQQDAVDAKLAAFTAAGMNYQGNVFQIDPGSISNMQTVMLAFLVGETSPSGGVWRSKANINVPMTDVQVKAFILTAQTYVKDLLFASWSLKDQIAKLTTLSAVVAFDITQGWPANNS